MAHSSPPLQSADLTLAAAIDALAPFSVEARALIRDAVTTEDGVLLVSPTMFTRLAAPVSRHIDSASRAHGIDAALRAGAGLSTPLWLLVTEHEREPGVWSVTQHDGRHRADALGTLGRRWVPVVLEVARWDDDIPPPAAIRSLWSEYVDDGDDREDEEEAEPVRPQERVEANTPEVIVLLPGDPTSGQIIQQALAVLGPTIWVPGEPANSQSRDRRR